MSKETHDELSDLLDSFQDDDTMEKKIEDFARKKERKSRTEKNAAVQDIKVHAQPKEEPEKIVLYHEAKEEQMVPEGDNEGTRVFTKQEIEEDAGQSSHTVVMNNAEIQTLIEENKGPALQRESALKKPPHKKNRSNPDKRKVLIIVLAVAGVLLIGGIVYGTIQLVNSSLHTDQTQEKHNNAFNDLKKYIENLGDDPKGLSGYESIYAKLSQSEKDEINELLRNKTGKTFEQIIEEIKSQKIEDSKNNNTQIAEQKAALKDQISELQGQLSSAKSELNNASSEKSSTESAFNAASQARSDAAAALQVAQNAEGSRASIQDEIDSIANQISELEQEDYSNETSDKLAELRARKTSLENQLAGLGSSDINAAQAAYDQADTAYNNAYNTYMQASDRASQAQATVDALNEKIAGLQNQLASLK